MVTPMANNNISQNGWNIFMIQPLYKKNWIVRLGKASAARGKDIVTYIGETYV
jgi:hypothetical protein